MCRCISGARRRTGDGRGRPSPFGGEVNATTAEKLCHGVEPDQRGHGHGLCAAVDQRREHRKALTIYNTLIALPIHLTVYNVGSVNSIGNVVFLAGRKRYACPGSTFMFHGIGVDLKSPARLGERELIEKVEAVRFGTVDVGALDPVYAKSWRDRT